MKIEAKICGIKTEAALDAALDGGARYVGLVLFEKSPRHVDLVTAKRLADRARTKASVVALLIDPDDALVQTIVREVKPHALQLHGSETIERIREM